MPQVIEQVQELSSMKNYPKQLSYSGDISLLKKTKISIVGTRKPSKYTREYTQKLASLLSRHGVCIVSGGAMGVDAMAHSGAGSSNTIAVLPCGIDIKYPSVNKNLLTEIEKNGLLLSQFEEGFKSRPWSFVSRNELVVALGEVLIVSEADLGSGSMRSVEYALKMKKQIYVFPQRLGESNATNELLHSGKAKAIYDIESFVAKFANTKLGIEKKSDVFLEYCENSPSYDEALEKFSARVFEAELNGEVEIINGKVILK
ncbi:MAG: DNA-protecting protein DprA [Helicobacteraceae bacterium]|nr:DNA-protecting protein DprA [Candidatus Sulfurimonas ponti]MBL6973451.1 DNA-protecting protein DprA [Sulfurimonas sp.]